MYSVDHPGAKAASGKVRTQTIMQAASASQRLFAGCACCPRFKRKQQQGLGGYFVKNDPTNF